MSVAVQDLRRTTREGMEPAVIVALGVALLLVRAWVAGASAPFILAALYCVLAALSLVPNVMREESPPALGNVAVLNVGLAAVVLAGVAVGPHVVVRAGAVAIGLNVAAAIAEEAFFRRFVYGRLVGLGVPTAIAGSALLFAVVHVPFYGVMAFWVDLGAGLLLSWQRWASGHWTTPAATHVAVNLFAVLR
jgi:membrane protease YdiL (CAAX protease family)